MRQGHAEALERVVGSMLGDLGLRLNALPPVPFMRPLGEDRKSLYVLTPP